MTARKRPRLRRTTIAADGSFALDGAEFRDGSGSVSYSDTYENSPELQRVVERVEDERRRARDCRFGTKDGGTVPGENAEKYPPPGSKDAAVIGTSRKMSPEPESASKGHTTMTARFRYVPIDSQWLPPSSCRMVRAHQARPDGARHRSPR